MPRSTPTPNDWRTLAAQLRAEIAAIRTPAGATPAAATRALHRLDDLEAAIEHRLDAELDARRRRVVGPRAPERPTTYLIESSPRGEALTEKREGVARPMKVPAPVYRTVARVVAALDAPNRFEDILAAVERAAGHRVPPYCVRVPLRFWSAGGHIHHEGARFARVGTRAEFARAVKMAWGQVEREPFAVSPD